MKSRIGTIVLIGSLSALVAGMCALAAPNYLYLFAALAMTMNLGAYVYYHRTPLRMRLDRGKTPVLAPHLHAMVEELSAKAETRRTQACVRNARHGVVVLSGGVVQLLDPREFPSVIAPAPHAKHGSISATSLREAEERMFTRAARALRMSALLRVHRANDAAGGRPSRALVLALVAPLAATLIQLGISRSREHLLDETGTRLSGDPDPLARALLKLEQAAIVAPAQTSTGGDRSIVAAFGRLRRVGLWTLDAPEQLPASATTGLDPAATRLQQAGLDRSTGS